MFKIRLKGCSLLDTPAPSDCVGRKAECAIRTLGKRWRMVCGISKADRVSLDKPAAPAEGDGFLSRLTRTALQVPVDLTGNHC